MTIEFGIKSFGPEIEEAYLNLFPNDYTEKDFDLLRWRFGLCPHGTGHFAVASEFNRIVGMIGLVATRFLVGERRVMGFQAVDAIVDPGYRRRGLFIGMGKAVHAEAGNHGAQMIWGLPNKQSAPGWFRQLGWKSFGMVPFMFRPLRSGYLFGKIAPLAARLDFPLAFRVKKSNPAARRIGRFGVESTQLCDDFNGRFQCTLERSVDWLNWRLFDRPATTYKVTGSFDRDGQCRAMVATTLADKHGAKICYLMEAMSDPHNDRDLAMLIRDEISGAAALGSDVALAWCPPSSPTRKIYRKAGFFPLPEMLRPIEMHFGARNLQPDLPPELSSEAAWYLSYLNSDTV